MILHDTEKQQKIPEKSEDKKTIAKKFFAKKSVKKTGAKKAQGDAE